MPHRPLLALSAALLLVGPAPAQPPADLDALRQQAIREAAQRVAPSVVQIQTSGGTDVIGAGPRGAQVRKGIGPTTGVIVSADGYIISSAFNFANKPSSIDVAIPGRKERLVAKLVATDHTSMVVLLKVEATGLPVPAAAPRQALRVGQTVLALGRTLEPNVERPPSVSEGIISALGRIWGKAVQTDAKVSPANYGGPLLDLDGRVVGVLVPASPRAEGEAAGFEWYDSGIGFAIPLEDINAVLPRLKQGKDLHKGMLGVTPKSADMYGVPPEVGSVHPGSPADAAGIKPGDVVKEIDGRPVANMAQLLHALGTKYEGDTISLKLLRGKEEVSHPKLVLGGGKSTTPPAFLGVLPMRDDPELGVEIRYVYPKSPADVAGLKAGDRIMKAGPNRMGAPLMPLGGRDHLMGLLTSAIPGAEIKLEIVRKEGKKTDTLTVKLAEVPEAVPDKLPEQATAKKALEPRKPLPGMPPPPPPKKEEAKKKPETGLIKRTNEAKDKNYWLYVPEDYDPNISYALVVWLHPVGKNKDSDIDDFKETWEDFCAKQHIILAGPQAENDTGWVASEADFVQAVAREVLGQYTIDRARVIAHGMGIGGQMAYYIGFHNRDLFRGVATTGAVLTNQVKERVPGQPLSFYLVAGGKDPLAKAIAESKAKLAEQKYPAVLREVPEMGHQYLDAKSFEELVRWIDALDRI